MLRLLWTVLISLAFFTSSTVGMDYRSLLVKGSSNIRIDGDLSDWKSYDISEQKLNQWMSLPHNRAGQPTQEGDLSTTFKAIADDDDLYLGISVTDDQVVFQRSGFGQTWWDDAVWIELGDTRFQVTRLASGRTVIEGPMSVGGHAISVPYLWEASGVEAEIGLTPTGYVVEMKIPLALVEQEKLAQHTRLNVNVAVVDHDHAGIQEHKLGFSSSNGVVLLSDVIQSSVPQWGFNRVHPNAKMTVSPNPGILPTVAGLDDQGRVTISLLPGNPAGYFDFSARSEVTAASMRALYLQAGQSGSAGVETLVWSGGLAGVLGAREGNFRMLAEIFGELGQIDDRYAQSWIQTRALGYKRGFPRTASSLPFAQAKQALEDAQRFAMEQGDAEFYFEVAQALIKVHEDHGVDPGRIRVSGIQYATGVISQLGTAHPGRIAAVHRLGFRLGLGESDLAQQEIADYAAVFEAGSDDHLDLLNRVGKTYRQAGLPEDALEAFRQQTALAQKPYQGVIGRAGMADAYMDMAKTRSAMAVLREAEQLIDEPKTKEEKGSLVLLHMTFVKAHNRWHDYSRLRHHMALAQSFRGLPPSSLPRPSN